VAYGWSEVSVTVPRLRSLLTKNHFRWIAFSNVEIAYGMRRVLRAWRLGAGGAFLRQMLILLVCFLGCRAPIRKFDQVHVIFFCG